jgi:hypothetical protein
VAFYTPSDPDYLVVKRIRQGLDRIDPVFDGFVAHFAARFGVAPLALLTDSMPGPGHGASVPRLGVVLEHTEDSLTFRHGEQGNFDTRKQRMTADLFMEGLVDVDLRDLFGLPRAETPRADDLFVYFPDFERVAIREAHDQVQRAELEAFEGSLDLGDAFWCTERYAGPPIVFVHTDEQAEAVRASGVQDHWADLYFPFAKRHDEFGYVRRETIRIVVDSRQNFDEHYQSNWFYYFK